MRPFIPKGEDDVEWNERSGPVPMASMRALAAAADSLWKQINTARRKEWPKRDAQGASEMANVVDVEESDDVIGSNAMRVTLHRKAE